MNPSKRAFTFLPLAAASGALLTKAQAATPAAAPGFGPRSAAFVQKMGIRYPIAQAGIGRASNPELAAAVSEAGGLGSLGVTWSPEADLRAAIARLRTLTAAPYALNYVLSFEPKTLQVALDLGAPVVQFSWGIPVKEAPLVRAAGAKLGVQVATLEGARQALDVGADYLICQGTEAGGHVHATSSWRATLPAILQAAGDVPVLVAGGIGDGRALREVLLAGAAGGLLGTRFLASTESPAHQDYKRKIVDASADDTIMTVCFNRGWANAPHRVLRNSTQQRWEAAGCPPVGLRPGEEDIVAKTGGAEIKRYSFAPPAATSTGELEAMALYAGVSVDRIRSVLSSRDIVRQIWAECTGTTA